jgi:hypothetical protein
VSASNGGTVGALCVRVVRCSLLWRVGVRARVSATSWQLTKDVDEIGFSLVQILECQWEVRGFGYGQPGISS